MACRRQFEKEGLSMSGLKEGDLARWDGGSGGVSSRFRICMDGI